MSIRDDYEKDWTLALAIRLAIIASFLSILAMVATGCSADNDRSRNLNLAVKGSYTPGTATETRNQVPQGGIDEKSGATPTKPTN